jgi:hypothetical protein
MILEVHSKQVWADYVDGIWINWILLGLICCEMLRYSVIPMCAKEPGIYNKGNVTALNTSLKCPCSRCLSFVNSTSVLKIRSHCYV